MSSQPVRCSGLPLASPASAQIHLVPGKICVPREEARVPGSNNPVEMISGVHVVAASAEIDVTTAERLCAVPLNLAAAGALSITAGGTHAGR